MDVELSALRYATVKKNTNTDPTIPVNMASNDNLYSPQHAVAAAKLTTNSRKKYNSKTEKNTKKETVHFVTNSTGY